MARILVLALLCSGCIAETLPPLETIAASDASAILDRWEDEGYPIGRCRAETSHLRILSTPKEHIADWCVRSDVAGCYLARVCADAGCFVVFAMAQDAIDTKAGRARLLRHEMTHWLLDCSGEVPLGDYFHEHEEWPLGFRGAYLDSER